MSEPAATRTLKRKLGSCVDTGAEARHAASFDGSKLAWTPDAVIRPRSEEDVATVLRHANRHRVPVTTRGAGSSLTGSASPVRGGWVLDLSGWRKLRVDRAAGMAYVQSGVRTGELQRAAARRGWFYPPDPSSKEFGTLGGNIACNAGGMRGGKYGVTRDYVLALRGVLPTGEIVSWSRDLRKYAAGYNMRDLWIGSEGTLGVITEAVLRLIPLPASRWTVLASFANETLALRTVKAILSARLIPSILEFLDRESVACAESATGESVFPGQAGRPVLLMELDGHPAAVRDERRRLLEIVQPRALAVREASDEKETEALWEVRRKCSGAMFELGDSKLNEDVVVPLRSQVKLMTFIRRLSRETGVPIATFGHAADGNFHVNIMYRRDDRDISTRALRALRALMRKVIELGGAISGEHGIGLAKTPFLTLEHGRAEIAAMRAVKQALDPNNILNPGKIFDVTEVWKKRPLKVRLPWDHK
jgi:glycolate oxidase